LSTDVIAKVREVLAKCTSSPSYVTMYRELVIATMDELRAMVRRGLESVRENIKVMDRKLVSRMVEVLTNVLNEANAVAFYASSGNAKKVREHAERLQSLLGAAEIWTYLTAEMPDVLARAFPRYTCPSELDPGECEALFILSDMDGEPLPKVIAEICRSMSVSQERANEILNGLMRKGFIAAGYSPVLNSMVIRVLKKPYAEW